MAQITHRGTDTAASSGDFCVGNAGITEVEFMFAGGGKDGVSVGVDEARGDQTAVAVMDAVDIGFGNIVFRTEVFDQFIVNYDSSVFDDADFIGIAALQRGGDFTDVA